MNTKNLYATVIAFTAVFTFIAYCLVTRILQSTKESKAESELVIEKRDSNLVIKEVYCPDTRRWMYIMSKIEFEGHTYIVVEDTGTAMLHDPDCKCNQLK